MKVNNFWGDSTDVSAKKDALLIRAERPLEQRTTLYRMMLNHCQG